jgi:hypothetical protein
MREEREKEKTRRETKGEFFPFESRFFEEEGKKTKK